MLGLRHEICRHDARVCCSIGNHADLGGTGDHIDAHVARHGPLGGGHVGVAGAHDLVDRGDGGGSIGRRGDGLRASDGVDLVHARHGRGGKREGRDGAACLRRGEHDDALHARDLGRDAVHEHGGGVLRTSTGHVERGRRDGHHAHAEAHAVCALVGPRLLTLELVLVELADLRCGMLERREELG